MAENQVSEPNADVMFYFLLRSADRFYRLHGRFPGVHISYPGTEESSFASDTVAYEALVGAFLRELGIPDVDCKNQIAEMYYFAKIRLRAGACQLPNIAAFVGGVASQEIIKLITQQYVPLNNCMVYNGITSTTSMMEI